MLVRSPVGETKSTPMNMNSTAAIMITHSQNCNRDELPPPRMLMTATTTRAAMAMRTSPRKTSHPAMLYKWTCSATWGRTCLPSSASAEAFSATIET